ncbi:MAG TPA: inositol monophosphatase family protein, partial [Candidatus Hydrogenedentes bacterium]|nr:inositol monophosphatase family protein [Candidatus Hydrogenedentota bacterium]
MKTQASAELDFIERFLKRISGYVVEKWESRHLVTVTSKGDPADLLTEVDLTVQKRFADALNQAFPDDALVAEEGSLSRLPDTPDGRAWVVDPI